MWHARHVARTHARTGEQHIDFVRPQLQHRHGGRGQPELDKPAHAGGKSAGGKSAGGKSAGGMSLTAGGVGLGWDKAMLNSVVI